MIHVNLLPQEERVPDGRPSLRLPKKTFWFYLGLGCAVLVPLLGMTAMQRAKISMLKSDIARAEEESLRLKPQIERIQTLQNERNDINQRLMTMQNLVRDRYLPVQVLDELADQTPEDLWFTRLSQKGTGHLEIEGMTFSNLLVADLMMQMEESDLFDGVALAVSERAKVGDGKVLTFTLSSGVKP